MKNIPNWLWCTFLVIGIIQILMIKNDKLMDIWYRIRLMKYSKVDKSSDKRGTLISGIGFIILAIFTFLISR